MSIFYKNIRITKGDKIMKASELVAILESIIKTHGDREVTISLSDNTSVEIKGVATARNLFVSPDDGIEYTETEKDGTSKTWKQDEVNIRDFPY